MQFVKDSMIAEKSIHNVYGMRDNTPPRSIFLSIVFKQQRRATLVFDMRTLQGEKGGGAGQSRAV